MKQVYKIAVIAIFLSIPNFSFTSAKEKDIILPENGVYIFDKNGDFLTSDLWDVANNGNVLGIALITNNTKALIALRNANTNGYVVWGPDGMVDGVVATSPNNSNQIPGEALTDYDGVNNTLKEVLQLNPGQNCALYLASHYEFPNGSKGYLPALGELTEMFENIESVNSLLKKVGGEELEKYLYWSSSQHSFYYRAWSYDATGSSHRSFAQLRNENSPLADIYMDHAVLMCDLLELFRILLV